LKVKYFVPDLPVKVRISIPKATGFLLHLIAPVLDAGFANFCRRRADRGSPHSWKYGTSATGGR
jgi:hypothetical protein